MQFRRLLAMHKITSLFAFTIAAMVVGSACSRASSTDPGGGTGQGECGITFIWHSDAERCQAWADEYCCAEEQACADDSECAGWLRCSQANRRAGRTDPDLCGPRPALMEEISACGDRAIEL